MKRIGFGQVEINHLSAQKTGQLYAQLPADEEIKVLENGQFAKYDYAKGVVNFTGKGEWLLVLNEVKLYDEFWRESYKDFAMVRPPRATATVMHDETFTTHMVPRLFKTNVGDIFTTNCLEVGNTSGREEVDMGNFTEGDILSPNADGYLSRTGNGDIQFEVVKVYTMPDGQPAVKLMRVE